MDDATLAAAARAIAFLGEAALRTTAADLVARARRVELDETEIEGGRQAVFTLREAAAALEAKLGVGLEEVRDAAGVAVATEGASVSDVCGAGAMLDEVERGRRQAVSILLKAASALEAKLGVALGKLRHTAGDLVRQCGEYRDAAAAIEKVRHAGDDNQRPWWMFWRARQPPVDLEQATPLLATGSTPTAVEAAARTSIDFLNNQAPDHLIELAAKIIQSADKLAVPYQTLVAAKDALQQADSASIVMSAVNDLEAAATGVKGAVSAQHPNPATQLVAACQLYLEASNAMDVVQCAAKARARQRTNGDVTGQNMNMPPPLPSLGIGRGDERRSGWLNYALCGSLTLAPYLAPTNAPPDKKLALSYHDRWCINLALSLWWTIVASGAVCSSYARSCAEVCYAQLAARVGMYGINIFAVYFFYWMLGIEDSDIRCYCVWFATAMHLFFLGLACVRRDP